MKKSYLGVVAGVVVLAFTSCVMADFSDPPNAGTPVLAPGGFLDRLYGLSNITRIEDFDAPATDQVWYNPNGGATAKAKCADYQHYFGYFAGESDGTFVALFYVPGGIYDIFPGPSATFTSAETGHYFRFGLDSLGAAPLWSSAQDENPDGGYDHMATWEITSADADHPDNPIGNYVVVWEDLYGLGDRSFDDLVVELSGVYPGGPAPIPEASTLMLFGSGLSGLLFYARKKRLIKF